MKHRTSVYLISGAATLATVAALAAGSTLAVSTAPVAQASTPSATASAVHHESKSADPDRSAPHSPQSTGHGKGTEGSEPTRQWVDPSVPAPTGPAASTGAPTQSSAAPTPTPTPTSTCGGPDQQTCTMAYTGGVLPPAKAQTPSAATVYLLGTPSAGYRCIVDYPATNTSCGITTSVVPADPSTPWVSLAGGTCEITFPGAKPVPCTITTEG